MAIECLARHLFSKCGKTPFQRPDRPPCTGLAAALGL